jgi:hypothetical protein
MELRLNNLLNYNPWLTGDMLLSGFWYQHLLGQKNQNISYKLLTNSPFTFVYSHLVIKAKFPMLPSAICKGNPRLLMSQPHFEESVKSPLKLSKMGLGSPLGLSEIQNLIVGVKTPCIEVFFIL